ncbi:MAG: Unknown protein [uncultured Aureispira sp.]|uniref:Uncharacterized protein n=1 Tax=uncultured Aureispira sp. TaxID=1331704 RepID=A0A6S6T828_9BACT|nr:MAG: Unknown protein [uncultured Aureispira sp.]
MTYLELAYKVLEETQRLLWVDDIWRIATEKGYTKAVKKAYTKEEDNINVLDAILYEAVGKHRLRLLEKKGLYYLVDATNLPAQIETALYGPSINSYQELVTHKKVKHFLPSTQGFSGMSFLFLLIIGFPISLCLAANFQGGFYLSASLVIGISSLLLCFAVVLLLYFQFTNCSIRIHSDRINIYRTFYPKNKIVSIPIKNLVRIEVTGLGAENQLNSTFKSLTLTYQNNFSIAGAVTEQEIVTKKIRCHGYINPSTSYDPFAILIRNFESFVTLRKFLKEIAVVYNIPYQEK